MKTRCKVCCFLTGLAVFGVAVGGTWAYLHREPPATITPEREVVKHASPPQVLASALERLHHEALAHFHADPQNGMARLPPVFEKVVKDWKTPWFSSGELDHEESLPFAKDMQRIHEGSIKDFLSPRALTKPPDQHSFAITWDPKKYDKTKKAWEAKSVDLIGLLKRATPTAYISDKVAAMQPGDEAPTRPLDEFEVAGLQALTKGDDLFGRSRDGVIRLLGSVRAETSCVSCHDHKKEGDLLGAFSYVLREAEYKRVPFGSSRPPGAVTKQEAAAPSVQKK